MLHKNLNIAVRKYEGHHLRQSCDDRNCNLDYRSLFLHFENNSFFYRSSIIAAIKDDFIATQAKCKEVKPYDRQQNMCPLCHASFFYHARQVLIVFLCQFLFRHDRRNLRGRVDTYSVVYRRSWTAENMVRCWRGMYNDYLHCAG